MVNVNEERYKRNWPSKKAEIDTWKTTSENREAVKKFLNICEGEKGLSYSRLTKYAYILKRLSEWAGFNFKDATRDDISHLITKVREKEYSADTDKDYRVCLKYFYKEVFGDDGEYPHCVKKVKTTVKKNKKRQRGDVIKEKFIYRVHSEVIMSDSKRVFSGRFLAILNNDRRKLTKIDMEIDGIRIKIKQIKGENIINKFDLSLIESTRVIVNHTKEIFDMHFVGQGDNEIFFERFRKEDFKGYDGGNIHAFVFLPKQLGKKLEFIFEIL